HGQRIVETCVLRDGIDTFDLIGTLLSVEDQASEVVIHEDVRRPPTLIAQGAGQIPTAQDCVGNSSSESLGSWDFPAVAHEKDVGRVILAESPFTHVRTSR